jgi:hypothetical protein
MKLLRMKTLGALGIGFLAGSRAGTGPWQKAQETVGQLKGKMDGTMGGSKGMSSNGSNGSNFEGQYNKNNPQMTEV